MKTRTNAYAAPSLRALALSVFLAVSAANPAQAVIPQIAAGATTRMAVDGVMSGINDSINQAKEAGDYVTALAFARALDALDAWKKTNWELMDKAFAGIDETSRQNFGRMRAAVIDIDEKIVNRTDALARLGDSANQIIASLLGGRPYIARFQPRIVPPNATDTYSIRINGVSLDKAEPVLALENGKAARSMIGPGEVQFTIPTSATAGNATAIQIHTLPVTYTQPKPGFLSWLTGATEQVSRQLPIVALPATLATYQVEGVRKVTTIETQLYEVDLGRFEGTNRDIDRAASPKSGWKWDVSDQSKFSVRGTGGNRGRCRDIKWSPSDEHSLTVTAHVDKIRSSIQYPSGAPGRITCHVKGPVYRAVATTEKMSPVAGTLGWLEDQAIALPADIDTYQVTVTTFDLRKKIMTSDDGDKFFELRKSGNNLTLVPKIPADIL